MGMGLDTLTLMSSHFAAICWKGHLHDEITQLMMIDFTMGVKKFESHVSKSTMSE
jgi:hypothetical protein